MTGLVYDRFLADEEERKEMQKIQNRGGRKLLQYQLSFRDEREY